MPPPVVDPAAASPLPTRVTRRTAAAAAAARAAPYTGLSDAGRHRRGARRPLLATLISSFVAVGESAAAVAREKLSGDGFWPAQPLPAGGARSASREETRLVQHVLKKAVPGDVDEAIRLFDDYSERHRLGLNLGREKGDVIEETVRGQLQSRGRGGRSPIVVLEVGAHLGDGTLRIVRGLRSSKAADEPPGGGKGHVVISLEANEAWASGCLAIVAHALSGSTSDSTVGHGVLHESLVIEPWATVAAARGALAALGVPHFDLVLLDHEHERYLEDLQGLESAGLLGPGCLVHADNVGRDRDILSDYLNYVAGSGAGSGGEFTTDFHEIRRPYRDRVSVSRYSPRGSQDL